MTSIFNLPFCFSIDWSQFPVISRTFSYKWRCVSLITLRVQNKTSPRLINQGSQLKLVTIPYKFIKCEISWEKMTSANEILYSAERLNAIMIEEIYAVKGNEIQNCQIAGSSTTSRRPEVGVWKFQIDHHTNRNLQLPTRTNSRNVPPIQGDSRVAVELKFHSVFHTEDTQPARWPNVG